MATIRARTTSEGKTRYQVIVRLKGYPKQTATFSRKTDAKAWAQKTETEIREGRYCNKAAASKHTFNELAERYAAEVLTRKSPAQQKRQGTQLEFWRRELGPYTLAEVSKARIVEARDKLMATPVAGGKPRSPASVNRYIAALSHMLNIAVDPWEWMTQVPSFKRIRLQEPQGRVRFLSDSERERLLEACSNSTEPLLYPLVVVALSTGARQGELLAARWSQVDLQAQVIRLEKTKNRERRAIPLAGRALSLLRDQTKVRSIDNDRVFPISPDRVRHYWLKALKTADVEDFRFHDLRHSTASYLAMNGATSAEIAEVLGHKTLQMVKRYAHLSEQHTTQVVASMNQKIFGE